jgi:hypothetical protein
MKIREKYVRRVIKEVLPLVEELSGLEGDRKYRGIQIYKNIPEEILIASYTYPKKIFNFNERISRINKHEFKTIIGHEIMHNVQLNNFPRIWFETNKIENLKNNYSISKRRENPLRKLMEGDATLIQRNLKEKYFVKSQEKISSEEYSEWEKILRDKFNGNRKDINELYNAPIEELAKIFN